jgi:hypothetical protein
MEETEPYLYHHVNRTGEWNEELRETLMAAIQSYHGRWLEAHSLADREEQRAG